MKRWEECACGLPIKTRIIDGYMSASSLGRPAGAKGMDCSTIESFCDCGNLQIVTVEEKEWFDGFDFAPIEDQFKIKIDRQNEVNQRPEILDAWGNYIGFVPTYKEPENWEEFINSQFEDCE